MDMRLKFLALACAAPLALAACEGAQEDQQVGQAQDPAAAPPAATDATQPERQRAEMPADQTAGAPPTAEPAAPQQDMAQAPQQDPAAPAGAQEAQVDFTGNWAMQGEACPGEWEFAEQTIESPEGTFEVQDIQQNGQEIELEVASMEGEQTQRLTLEFPDAQQQDTMIVRAAGDQVTLERCQ